MTAKTIRYSNKINPEFINELRNKVNNYFEFNNIDKYGNFNMYFKTGFMFLLYFSPYFVMLTSNISNPFVLLLLWITMGFGMAGIGLSVMHDANHGSYSKNKNINKVLSYTLHLLGGFVFTWQYQHNTLHHGYTNIDGFDEDIDPVRILRFSPNKPHYKIHKFQHLYAWILYGLMTLTWSIDKDFKQLHRYHKEGIVNNQNKSIFSLYTELIISKIIYYSYILVIPVILLPVPWWMVLLFYLSMHFICGFILGIIFQTAHVMPTSKFPLPDEDNSIANNWAIHQLQTTTNYSPKSSFFSWYIGALNYQVEHHLFPNICHVHYRRIALLVKQTTMEYNLPYYVQPNFLMALYSHLKMLKALGNKNLKIFQ